MLGDRRGMRSPTPVKRRDRHPTPSPARLGTIHCDDADLEVHHLDGTFEPQGLGHLTDLVEPKLTG